MLRAVRETKGGATAVSDEAMARAADEPARMEGISACLEGAATLAGLRRFMADGTVERDATVLLVNTGRGTG